MKKDKNQIEKLIKSTFKNTKTDKSYFKEKIRP